MNPDPGPVPFQNGAVGAMARVLVTGGAGFIGSHVVDALLAAGATVTVLDDLSNGSRDNLPAHPRLRLVVGDVCDPVAVSEALGDSTRVIHLAAIASVQRSVEDPVGTHRVNYEATLRLLDASRRLGVERVVYASSAAVYGDVQAPPVDELGAVDPSTPYAIDKFMGEKALAYHQREHGLQCVALRFFNVYGPRQRADSPYSGVISQFVRRALAAEAVTVFGDGGQTRDFVFVGDVARAVVELALRSAPPSAPILNVGRGEDVSVLGLIDAIETVTALRLDRRFAGARSGEVRHSRASVERLRRELGWLPPTTLGAGLRSFVPQAEASDGMPAPAYGCTGEQPLPAIQSNPAPRVARGARRTR